MDLPFVEPLDLLLSVGILDQLLLVHATMYSYGVQCSVELKRVEEGPPVLHLDTIGHEVEDLLILEPVRSDRRYGIGVLPAAQLAVPDVEHVGWFHAAGAGRALHRVRRRTRTRRCRRCRAGRQPILLSRQRPQRSRPPATQPASSFISYMLPASNRPRHVKQQNLKHQ